MSRPYLIISDTHFHEWSAFSTTLPSGVNSRLQTSIDEVKRAAMELREKGGKNIYLAGDVFHVRGSVSPKVLNPVCELFEQLCSSGLKVRAIAGNHDLADKESNKLSNMANALAGVGVDVVSDPKGRFYLDDNNVVVVPWHSTVNGLKETLNNIVAGGIPSILPSEMTLIIHAPIDNVIFGLPEHGLTADYLKGLNFKRVFAGHYHNHKNFDNKVYSIGALTHISFSDVGSKAGYLIVNDDEVNYRASYAPQFVDINEENFDDLPLLVDGNFVRCKIKVSKESEVEELRKHIISRGAKGVVINQIKETTVGRSSDPEAKKVGGSFTLEQSVTAHITDKGYKNEVAEICMGILSEVGE